MRGWSLSIVIAFSIMNPAAYPAQSTSEPVRYMDAHSHLVLPNVTPDEEIALLKKAGIAAVVIMHGVADARGVPVTIHVSLDTIAVIDAFGLIAESHPRMPLILAHAGWTAGPKVVEGLLATHPNLYVDLSVRLDPLTGFGVPPVPRPNGPNQLSILNADGSLQPEWLALLERFPDRFLFAMDVSATGVAGRQEHIGELLAHARTALGALPRETHEAIAHGNLEKLLHACGVSNPER